MKITLGLKLITGLLVASLVVVTGHPTFMESALEGRIIIGWFATVGTSAFLGFVFCAIDELEEVTK